jgi:RNA polymerase sigma-70 factor (ECF subfamily)
MQRGLATSAPPGFLDEDGDDQPLTDAGPEETAGEEPKPLLAGLDSFERRHLWTQIYLGEFEYVRQRLRRLGVPERDVPDITQDVFVTVYRRLDTYDPARPLRPWLFGVLYRVASDNLRLGHRRREIYPAVGLDAEDPTPGPEDTAAQRQGRRLAKEILDSLDPRLRDVLLLHDFGGHSALELAGALGIPLKTVYTRLRLGRQRLAGALGRLGHARLATGQRTT